VIWHPYRIMTPLPAEYVKAIELEDIARDKKNKEREAERKAEWARRDTEWEAEEAEEARREAEREVEEARREVEWEAYRREARKAAGKKAWRTRCFNAARRRVEWEWAQWRTMRLSVFDVDVPDDLDGSDLVDAFNEIIQSVEGCDNIEFDDENMWSFDPYDRVDENFGEDLAAFLLGFPIDTGSEL